MDVSGSNRYELLFMDDEGSSPALMEENITRMKKDLESNSSSGVKSVPATNKKVANNVEKENKSSALNKNKDQSVNKKATSGPGPKSKQVGREFINRSDNNDHRGDSNDVTQNNKEGREVRNNRRIVRDRGGEYSNENQQRSTRQFRDRENRGPPRSRFGENTSRGGKREFDRQSGSDKTGVKAVDKRDGAGAHNWGSVKQEIEDINKSAATDVDTALTDKEESANDQLTTETGMSLEEEEVKEMTLDEWKAMKEQRAKPQFNIRKAGEGEDNAQWKKMIILNKKKKKEEVNSEDEELEYDPSMYPQRVGRLQRIVDIHFNFNDNRRSGTGFGRGRGRGSRPNGGDRVRFENGDAQPNRNNLVKPQRSNKAQKSGTTQLKVDDERQFPTLS